MDMAMNPLLDRYRSVKLTQHSITGDIVNMVYVFMLIIKSDGPCLL